MSFTVAFLILFVGILVGYHLPGPVARIRRAYRRHTYKPTLLKPVDLHAIGTSEANRSES